MRETLTDGLRLARLDALAVAQAASPQVSIQLRQILHLRHRRGPIALQVPHPPLDVRLLLRPARQTKQRLEGVVTAQRQVAVVQAPLASHEQLRRHRLGIVPPELVRHAAEEVEALDQAVQDGFGPLRRQRQRERIIRVCPSEQQHRHLAAAIGKVHVDVAEVRFEPLARIVVEWDERLAPLRRVSVHIATHAVVTAGVAVLVAQPAKDLRGRVLLLGRRRRVNLQDRLDHRLEGINDRGHRPPLIGRRFGLGENLANLAARVVKPPRQFADAHLINEMSTSNACIFVHRDHPPPPCSWNPGR